MFINTVRPFHRLMRSMFGAEWNWLPPSFSSFAILISQTPPDLPQQSHPSCSSNSWMRWQAASAITSKVRV